MFKRILCGIVGTVFVLGLLGGCSLTGGTPNAALEPSPLPKDAVDELFESLDEGSDTYYREIAAFALNDALGHFWTGDRETGHIARCWNGFIGDGGRGLDPRGSGWESGMLLFAVYDLWMATGDDSYRELVEAEAAFYRNNFRKEELVNAGGEFNWASDDCAWNAMQFLAFHTVTDDDWFLECAIELLDNTRARWFNEELNGMYYRDDADYMSLYEVGCAISWLRIWEITGEDRYYQLAEQSYEGMHSRLVRDDGIYHCEANVHWPLGSPNEIMEARSSSFLTGNMGMAALSAKFYKITGDKKYLDRVYATNEGLLKYYSKDGVLLNDRDAWTNGAFAAYYAAEVLSLPDTEEMQTLLQNTAVSILRNARTTTGYYGGSWKGPAEGSSSKWYVSESVPQQIMTTSTSVLIVVASAVLEAQLDDYAR